MVEICVNLEDLKIGDPIIFPFNSSVWPLEKKDGSWRMSVDVHKHNQVLVPTAATMTDVYLS